MPSLILITFFSDVSYVLNKSQMKTELVMDYKKVLITHMYKIGENP